VENAADVAGASAQPLGGFCDRHADVLEPEDGSGERAMLVYRSWLLSHGVLSFWWISEWWPRSWFVIELRGCCVVHQIYRAIRGHGDQL
jgi:hypothetical protein